MRQFDQIDVIFVREKGSHLSLNFLKINEICNKYHLVVEFLTLNGRISITGWDIVQKTH